LDNATLHHEESTEEKCTETSTAFSIPFEEITNTDRPNLSTESPTESTTYRHDNDTTESQFDKNPESSSVAENARNQGEPTNSGDGSSIPVGTAAIFEPQQDVLPSEQKESHPPVNNSLTPANHEDMKNSTLSLDEVATGVTASDSTSADEEVTTDFVNEIRGNGNAKMLEICEGKEFIRQNNSVVQMINNFELIVLIILIIIPQITRLRRTPRISRFYRYA